MQNPSTVIRRCWGTVTRVATALKNQYSLFRLFRDKRLGILAAANIFDTMSTTIVVPVLPTLAESVGASPFVIGLMFTAPAVVGAIIQAPAGYLSDRWGRRPLISVGMLLSAFPVIAIAFAWSPMVLLVLRGLDGLFRSFVSPATNAYIGDAYTEDERGQAFGAYHTSGMIGAAVGPVLGGAIAEFGGYRLPFIVLGLGTLLGGIVLLLFLPTVRTSQTPEPDESEGLFPDISMTGVRVYLSAATLAWLAIVFVDQFGSSALRPTISPLLTETVDRGPAYVGTTYSALAVAILLFLPIGGQITDRVGRVRVLFVSYGGWAGVLIGLALATHPVIPPVLMFLGGVLSACAVPALYALRYELAPAGKEATFSGITGIAESVGEATGPLFAGLGIGLWGVKLTVIAAGVSWVLAIPLLAVLGSAGGAVTEK